MRDPGQTPVIAVFAALAIALGAFSVHLSVSLADALRHEAGEGYSKWALSVAKGLVGDVAPDEGVPVFRWVKGRGIVDPGGAPAAVLDCIDGAMKWRSDGKSSVSLPYGVCRLGGETVAWGRPKAGEVAGAVLPRLDATHAGARMRVYRALSFAVMPLAAMLLAVALCLAWRERCARREALEKVSFVDNVSHELRTPLTPIAMYGGMLADGAAADAATLRRWGEEIVAGADRLDRLVAGLLELGRADGGRKCYDCAEFPLERAVRAAVAATEGRFAAHGLSVALPEEIRVFADEGATEQIIANLIDNAAKYAADSGPVEVRAAAASGRVELVVADRGPGVAKADLERMFERFWRADDSLRRRTGGSGIGLAVARTLAEGMGGTLTAALRDGGGLEFKLALPQRRMDGRYSDC